MENTISTKSQRASESQTIKCQVYRQRWIMLGIFVLYSACNAMQWVQYCIIPKIVEQFYNINVNVVESTSLIYMIAYIPFIIPVTHCLEKYGLRCTILLGAFGNAFGSCIKIFSAHPDKFWIGFIGQTFLAMSQTCVLSVPSKLAGVWFGIDEVSSACSIGVLGNLFGVGIGFLIPPLLVPNSNNVDEMANGFLLMFSIYATINVVLFVVVILFFKNQPPLPPSLAQAVQKEAQQGGNIFKSMKKMFASSGFLLLLTSYGMNSGCSCAIASCFGSIIQAAFRESEREAGQIGCLMIIAGMLGAIAGGLILDKTHKFKETTFGVYLLTLVAMILFTISLLLDKIILVYLTGFVLGFFTTGYFPVGFEFGVELTYPEPEGTSSGLLNLMTQISGILLTLLYQFIYNLWNKYLWSNVALCIVLTVGTIMTIMLPNHLKRQNAQV